MAVVEWTWLVGAVLFVCRWLLLAPHLALAISFLLVSSIFGSWRPISWPSPQVFCRLPTQAALAHLVALIRQQL